MTPRELDRLLDLWALWILRGCNARAGFASMLEMMITTGCQFNGGGGVPNDEIETSVEGAVALLTVEDELAATVLRLECGVWRFKEDTRTQLDRAVKLRLSLGQYRRKLAKARAFVDRQLDRRAR